MDLIRLAAIAVPPCIAVTSRVAAASTSLFAAAKTGGIEIRRIKSGTLIAESRLKQR